ncbi:MAG: type IV toxin-antitoxin system AbiEi family antitoxin domain-containing protein [Patulibacter sp.]
MTFPAPSNGRRALRPGDRVRATVNAQISRVAGRQHGLITTRQLAACGLGRGAIAHRRSVGVLIPVAPRVLAVGRPAEGALARHLAAVLSIEREAWLSHRSAAAVWDLTPFEARQPVDLLVEGTPPRSRPDVRIRQTKRLDQADRGLRKGLPVTGIARTVVDLAGVLATDRVERVVAEAFALHRCRPADVRAALERTPTRRGHGTVRAVLEQADGPRRTRSEAERRFLEMVRTAGIESPRTNAKVGRYEVDAVWARERVIVEIDGYAFHGSRHRFEHDRRKDAELQAAGWIVFRVTWRGLTDDTLATVARLSAVLTSRREDSGERGHG